MKTILMNPTAGQMVRNEDMGIVGMVVDVLDFEDVHNWMPASQLEAEGARLAKELGSDYRRIFFEVVVDVLEANDKAEYAAGEQAILTLEEFQKCVIIQGAA